MLRNSCEFYLCLSLNFVQNLLSPGERVVDWKQSDVNSVPLDDILVFQQVNFLPCFTMSGQ